MSDRPKVNAGDRVKIELCLIRPLDPEERITFPTGKTELINNIRGNLWWAGWRTDLPSVILCLDQMEESDIIRNPSTATLTPREDFAA